MKMKKNIKNYAFIDLGDFSVADLRSYVYDFTEYNYNKIYYICIWDEENNLLKGPMPFISLFISYNDRIIEELFTLIYVEASKENIDVISITIFDLDHLTA